MMVVTGRDSGATRVTATPGGAPLPVPPLPDAVAPYAWFVEDDDRWVTLDVSGTVFKTFASTLAQTPSVLQAPAQLRAHIPRGEKPAPIAVDVEADTFAYILDFLRYQRLEQDLSHVTLGCIARAARRLGMDALAREAKYIYPLRHLKRLAKGTQEYDRAYFRYFRECWIRGTQASREALQPTFIKAMAQLAPRRHPYFFEHRCKAQVDGLLANNSASAYVLDAIDFADFLSHHGYVTEADSQLNILVPWLLALPPMCDEADCVRRGIELRLGHKTPVPFFALCAQAYVAIDSTVDGFCEYNFVISAQDPAVLAAVASVTAHGAAKYSLHAAKLAVAANLFDRPLLPRHVKILSEEARQAGVAPSSLLYSMLKHEIWAGTAVFDRHLIELLSWLPLKNSTTQGTGNALCAQLIAMLYLNHGNRPHAERWTRRWHQDIRGALVTHEALFLTRCSQGLQLLRRQRHDSISVLQFAAELKSMAVTTPSGWQAFRLYLFA